MGRWRVARQDRQAERYERVEGEESGKETRSLTW